jgi:hypothetical protein
LTFEDGLHSIISQNIELFGTTGVRTSTPKYKLKHYNPLHGHGSKCKAAGVEGVK